MGLTSIDDVHATGRGLQHGFGVAHAVNLTPLPQLQKWLGHEDIDTTVIYMQATDDEKCVQLLALLVAKIRTAKF